LLHALRDGVAVSCLTLFALAQTAEELVSKNIEAKAGMEKIKAVRPLRVTGKLIGGGGFTAAAGQESLRRNLLRETFSLQGMTATTAGRWLLIRRRSGSEPAKAGCGTGFRSEWT
jgi:O-glycosyl hydrolase